VHETVAGSPATGLVTVEVVELCLDEQPDSFYGGAVYRLVPRNQDSSPVEVDADWSSTDVSVGA
jgi:hypothetical protein